jgi:metal-sulfur cluster biosynthetic enzyme
MLKDQDVFNALKGVIDPELGINVVDLGLVYGVEINEGVVRVEMTLTSPGCPLAGLIDQMVKSAVGKLKGVERVELELVWDPPWIPAMMSEEVREEFGVGG